MYRLSTPRGLLGTIKLRCNHKQKVRMSAFTLEKQTELNVVNVWVLNVVAQSRPHTLLAEGADVGVSVSILASF